MRFRARPRRVTVSLFGLASNTEHNGDAESLVVFLVFPNIRPFGPVFPVVGALIKPAAFPIRIVVGIALVAVVIPVRFVGHV